MCMYHERRTFEHIEICPPNLKENLGTAHGRRIPTAPNSPECNTDVLSSVNKFKMATIPASVSQRLK